jgi:hypothetical protein
MLAPLWGLDEHFELQLDLLFLSLICCTYGRVVATTGALAVQMYRFEVKLFCNLIDSLEPAEELHCWEDEMEVFDLGWQDSDRVR